MSKVPRIFLILIFVFSCKTEIKNGDNLTVEKPKNFNEVIIEDIVVDSLLNVRAIEIKANTEEAFFATADGKVGRIFNTSTESEGQLNSSLKFEYLNLDFEKYHVSQENFRSIALSGNSLLVAIIGSPAHIYKIEGDDSLELVYIEEHEKAFYDSIEFWNDQEGLAIGDSTEGCISIVITRDGGNNWTKVSCDSLPAAKNGVGAFAASDTNIAIVGENTWIATGGKSSQIYYSADKGKSWEVFETPIIQGEETTGIYSIDFYDEKNGFAVGGDYTKPELNSANKIITKDGGKSWKVVANSIGPGYRSCVKYVPDRNANDLVTLGFNGIDYSSDRGESWKHLSDEGYYTLRFINDSTAYAAGKGRISKLIFSREN
ncbi:hypothetical protein SAMN03097699_0242 [Flavobacteriaceae bacterium MAR_2010_188]|nr:hypothetical protein SAMN03097699_0242 [Flavobacteriaceae bacterium MAR_2010_188]